MHRFFDMLKSSFFKSPKREEVPVIHTDSHNDNGVDSTQNLYPASDTDCSLDDLDILDTIELVEMEELVDASEDVTQPIARRVG